MRETGQGKMQDNRGSKLSPPDRKLEADVESEAAQDEPMGSVAAAVPGSNQAAEDVCQTGRMPGGESPLLRDQPETTAGTEAKLKKEETGAASVQRKPTGRQAAD